MDENRLITAMLWVVMIIWAVGIGIFYFFNSDRLKDDQTHSSAKLSDSKTFKATQKASLPSQIPAHPTPSRNRVDQSVKQSVTPPPSSSVKGTITPNPSPGTTIATPPQTKEVRSLLSGTKPETRLSGTTEIKSLPSQTSIAAKASTQPVVKSVHKPAINTPDTKPAQEIIHETSKANGTFYSAQKITAGVINGNRGSSGDVVDYYKITADGNTMILKVEPFLEEEHSHFLINVYDAKQQQIGKISEKTDSHLNISVSPQAIYYIGIDLRDAPIEKPPYTFQVNFR